MDPEWCGGVHCSGRQQETSFDIVVAGIHGVSQRLYAMKAGKQRGHGGKL